MPETTDDLMREYYTVLTAGAQAYDEGARMRPLLDPDLLFEGPIAGRVVGAEMFIKGVSGFIETVQAITMLHEIRTADAAATMYDAELAGGEVRMAEFHAIEDGRIRSLRLMYDPAEYTARGGR